MVKVGSVIINAEGFDRKEVHLRATEKEIEYEKNIM